MICGGEQLWQSASARDRDPLAPRTAALTAILQGLAATLDIPVTADDLTARGRHSALTGGELTRDRQRRILRVITRNTPIEHERLHPATPIVGLDSGRDGSCSRRAGDQRPTTSAPVRMKQPVDRDSRLDTNLRVARAHNAGRLEVLLNPSAPKSATLA